MIHPCMNSMISLTAISPIPERPRGVVFISALAFCAAAASVAIAMLHIVGVVPLATGASLLGGGLEILGPVAFLLYGLATGTAGFGLLHLRNWARWLTILILLFGVVQIVPGISMAVADGRILAIAREGLQIIVRTAALWYLCQEPVRDLFA